MVKTSKEQNEAIALMQSSGWKGVCWWKPGEGKTRIGLRCAEVAEVRKIIIVCPRKAMDSWIDEIHAQRFFISFEILSADNLDKVAFLDKHYDDTMLIVDELYYFASADSHRSKMLRRLSLNFPYRIGLSGTIKPTNNNETVYWQLHALHLQGGLAQNITQFREEYRISCLSHFSVQTRFGKKRVKQMEDKPGSQGKIIDRIKEFVHVYFPDNEHRKIREQIVKCKLSAEQIRAIRQIKKEFQLEIEGRILDYKFSMEILFAICKISNGWITDKEKTKRIDFKANPKLDQLLGILEPLAAGGYQAVIWCHFRNDVEYLRDHLPYKTLTFWGGEAFDRQKWETGKFQFVLATADSGASVNYFGNVEYAIYYSLPLKLVSFLQSKGRHERKSSNHAGAFYYYLQGSFPSLDGHLLKMLQENNDAEKDLVIAMAKNFIDKDQET